MASAVRGSARSRWRSMARRSAAFPQRIYDATRNAAQKAQLSPNGNGVTGVTAGGSATANGNVASRRPLRDGCGFAVAMSTTCVQSAATVSRHATVEELLARRPDYVLVLAWNFAEEIMRQREELADQLRALADLKTMAPGVSGALVTTVAGLLVAIPSMFGYNWLVHNLRVLTVELDNFAQELVSKMETEYLEEES